GWSRVVLVGEERRDPGERRVPVDGHLVRRVRLDVVDVAELWRAALEQVRRERVVEGGVRAARKRTGRRVRQALVELVTEDAAVLVLRALLAPTGHIGVVERVAPEDVV